MALKEQIFQLVEPLVSKAGYILEEVQVQTPGKHRFVTVIVYWNFYLIKLVKL